MNKRIYITIAIVCLLLGVCFRPYVEQVKAVQSSTNSEAKIVSVVENNRFILYKVYDPPNFRYIVVGKYTNTPVGISQ